MQINRLMQKRAILWDWNGTLLDDTDICVQCINSLLETRQLNLLNKERYRKIFTFPV
ncbi:MAG: HAD family hydrolase, partial [Bacteroidetes bacterium]